MTKTIFDVLFIHVGIGIGLSIVFFYCLDFLLGTNFFNYFFYTTEGIWFTNVFGSCAVALAIKDGQFIDHVKKSHWSNNRD
ncbi:hypothetical protein RO575_21695 [Methylomonas sp. MO1]|uniref:hypothetical protein n=1 Tax=Methylomonas sp. MO1 TaxID=3073619 RepID=UPI0028A53936|nr:hypothetical protein [Methylomonas sp. MO1]MDT4292187.1 hypothetical protein [Methylomonas sp. MO1]